jgi:hypothetical protein
MGIAKSPKVVTDGLVFYYDQNNIKSYAGPAIQNLSKTLISNYHNTTSSATGRSYAGGYENVIIPQIGSTRSAYIDIQNNYTSFSPNSGDCCPSPHTYGSDIVVSPSTLYTYAIVYKVNSGYTHPNYMYRYEYTSLGGTYVTEAGVHSDSNRIHLGDGWYWAWGTFTTQATTNILTYVASFYYRYSQSTDRLSIAKVLIAPGNHTGLHPKYWPDVNTTRSSTQSLVDITSRKTITVSNLTYSSNGAFSFNGTNSGITTSSTASSLGISNNITISLFTRRAASPTNALQGQVGFGSGGSISIKNSDYYFADVISTNNTRYIVPITPAGGSMSSYANVWVNLCVTVSGTSINTYLNGVLATSQTMDSNIKGFSSETLSVGEGYGYFRLQGDVDNVNVYNRALTASEVAQNFNSLKGRYGI